MTKHNEVSEYDPALKASDVHRLVSYSVSQLYRMIKVGTFPAPLRLGPGRVGWRRSVIEDWLRQRETGA